MTYKHTVYVCAQVCVGANIEARGGGRVLPTITLHFLPESQYVTVPEALFQLSYLASELLEPTCLCLSSTSMMGLQAHAPMPIIFMWVLGI